jgi:hypothetical protein
MKDTVHHPVHLSVHLTTSGSTPLRRTCTLWSTQFGRGQTSVLGWNDPGFGRDFAPKIIRGRSSPTKSWRLVCPRVSWTPIETVRNRVTQVKNVRISACTFGAATSSPQAHLWSSLSNIWRNRASESHCAKQAKSGGSDPTFSAFSRPKSSWGRSRPPARQFVPHFFSTVTRSSEEAKLACAG